MKTRMMTYREEDAAGCEVELVPWLETGQLGQVDAHLLTVLHSLLS